MQTAWAWAATIPVGRAVVDMCEDEVEVEVEVAVEVERKDEVRVFGGGEDVGVVRVVEYCVVMVDGSLSDTLVLSHTSKCGVF
jgi:hypothetical protein